MKTSLLTQSLNDYQHAVHQLQQLNKPAPHADQIRSITMAYQTKPSMIGDGKDWARLILQEYNFGEIANVTGTQKGNSSTAIQATQGE